ncbi:hypothetical protein [Heyndrickxia faecalis]|uniref:hypothetical protein n=1 Tax=Heyndrickxia faecalis TaxID=2824910 RepID=UPI003D1EF138
MKVFKMNECDLVAAETEGQAKEFYKKEFGFDDIAIDFEGEVPLTDTILINVDDLLEEEQLLTQEFTRSGNELFVNRSFKWVIEKEKITSPCIIASTEY